MPTAAATIKSATSWGGGQGADAVVTVEQFLIRALRIALCADRPPTEAALQGPGLWRKIIRDRVRPLAAFSHLLER
jgi:hypothetical protein